MTSLSAGPDYACAVTSIGATRCWGGQIAPRTGYAMAPRPVALDVPVFYSGIASIAAGANHVCVLTTGGGVKCWGSNFNGQLGDGTDSANSNGTFVDVVGLASGVTAIAAGDSHTCAIAGGGVRCWGYDVHGELGNGSTTVYRVPAPVAVVGLASGVAAISAGTRHTCALTTAGGVKCWGSDFHGELGTGDWTAYSSVPMDVVGLSSGATAIAAGGAHTCAVKDGAALCWGTNTSGQVGDGSAADRYAPVAVAGASSGILRISTGDKHSCALRGDGKVACWGAGTYGQLGDGRLEYGPTPVDVGGFRPRRLS